MKDRLVELLIKGNNQPCGNGSPWEDDYCKGCEYEGKKDCRVLQLADYLLAKGVIVPPCKVGDKVYHIRKATCENIDGLYNICEFYRHSEDNLCALPKGECPYVYRIAECNVTMDNLLIVTEKWGKTVFLTKEEAEQALRKEDEGK